MSKSKNIFNLDSDEILMEKFKRGDSSAFEELYRRYFPKLTYYMRKLLNNDTERAKDLSQDIFMKIIREPKSFNSDRKFSVWLFKVAYNRFVNEYHSRKIIDYSDDNFDNVCVDSSFELNIDSSLAVQLIDAEIEQMNETYKTTFILKYKEQYSLQEIADVLNCPIGTVKSRLFNIIKKISNCLEKNEISKGFYYEK